MANFQYEMLEVELEEDNVLTESVPACSSPTSVNTKAIWNGKKSATQKAQDDEGTMLFLGLVKSEWASLNDNKTKKKIIWRKIAKCMEEAGFVLGEDPGLKVETKWHNMMKTYKNYIKESEKTGSGSNVLSNTPPYFDELQEIIGEGHNVHPFYLGDSLYTIQNPTEKKKTVVSDSRKITNLEEDALEEPCEDLNPRQSKKIRPSKSSNTEKLLTLVQDSMSKKAEQTERILKKKEEREAALGGREKEREERIQRRHDQLLSATNSLVSAMNRIAAAVEKKKKRRRSTSESE